jgi:anaerobic ribonucleoside-triphosphate reductase
MKTYETIEEINKAPNICVDCEKEFEDINILEYKDGSQKIYVHKCKECYEKNESLDNFRECEVFTRIVGYLRPKKSANPGKQQEMKERVNYKL